MTDESPAAHGRVTSADVARRAGVSRSTVSQILNGDVARFPHITQQKVRATAAELGYRPSRAGRALVTGLSDIVVVLVPNATFGPHLQDSVDRLARSSATSGLSVLVRYAGDDSEGTLLTVLDLRPVAVVDLGILTDEQRSRLRSAGTVVAPASPSPQQDDRDPLDLEIGRIQVAHLTRTEPRLMVYVGLGDARHDPFGPPRFEGIRREAAARGLPLPRAIRVPLTLDGATDEVRRVMATAGEGPVGFCCYNDDVAIAVLAATRALGLSVPSDASLVGVDRTDVGQLISPRLTTVHIDLVTLMEQVADEISRLRKIDRADAPVTARSLSSLASLVVGETS